MKTYRAELIGLLGCPVDENPTVVPIEAAFHALHRNGRYITMQVQPEGLGDAIRGLRATSFLGTHITLPHKVSVLKYLDELSPEAALIGAVNTVVFRSGKAYGENTDGKGFLMSLEQNGISPAGKTVTILGAGGAARAIAVELALRGAKKLYIINRSEARGTALAALVRERVGTEAQWLPFPKDCAIPQGTDLLVQATNIGLFPDSSCPAIHYESLTAQTVVCDIIPNPTDTAFLQKARARGCRTLNGLDMLVNQGAISFRLWTGAEPPREVMKRALKEAYGAEDL